MSQRLACLTLLAFGLFGPVTVAQGQEQFSTQPGLSELPPVIAYSPRLQAALERIAEGSALWREAVDAIRQSGRHAFVLTPDEVAVLDPGRGNAVGAFDPTVLAEVAIVSGPTPDAVSAVLVVANLSLLDRVHAERSLSARERNADLDRILIHEVYGHALPYLAAGNLSGRCADPGVNELPSQACSIRRENAVRAELGLGYRTDYGLGGLALARPTPWASEPIAYFSPLDRP